MWWIYQKKTSNEWFQHQSLAKIWRREIYFEILVTDQTLVTDFAVLSTDFEKKTSFLKWTTVSAYKQFSTALEIVILQFTLHFWGRIQDEPPPTTRTHTRVHCGVSFCIDPLNEITIIFEMPFLWFFTHSEHMKKWADSFGLKILQNVKIPILEPTLEFQSSHISSFLHLSRARNLHVIKVMWLVKSRDWFWEFWEFVIVIFYSYRCYMIRKVTQLDEDNTR